MAVGVIIARLQPIHKGHLELVRQALNENDEVLILVGSADKLNKRNPIPIAMRLDLARKAVGEEFGENAEKVKTHYDNYICDYDKSMVIDKEVTFPLVSSFNDYGFSVDSLNWVWCKRNGDNEFSFDSLAEKEWAKKLKRLAKANGAEIDIDAADDYDEIYLWGKNFPLNSEIKYEYYTNGIHSSYPDFILKDKSGHIHIFEVKSVNKSATSNVDTKEYEAKVKELQKCYEACSRKLPEYRFYLPVMKGEEWRIHRYLNGEYKELTFEDLKESLKETI